MEDETLLSDVSIILDNSEELINTNTEVPVVSQETLIFYENMLALELAQTSLLIVIFITVLFSGIYKIGR